MELTQNNLQARWYQAADGKNFSLWPNTWKYWLDTRKVNPKDYLLLNKCSQNYAA